MTKKSWFGNLMGNEREETHVLLIKDKPLAVIKADLIHTFLSVFGTLIGFCFKDLIFFVIFYLLPCLDT